MAIRKFHWSSVHDCVMHETDGLGNTLVEYTHEPSPYGPLISVHRDGQEYVHHYDALGSTTMLTDETGSVTDTFVYDAWGNQVSRTGTTDTTYRWVGQWGYQFDESTECYYVRARVYQPTIARWTSVDPFGMIDSINMFSYCKRDAVNTMDPSGKMSWSAEPIELKDCGWFKWVVHWKPDRGEREAWIIQKVTMKWIIYNCNLTEHSHSRKCGDTIRGERVYWEVWYITDSGMVAIEGPLKRLGNPRTGPWGVPKDAPDDQFTPGDSDEFSYKTSFYRTKVRGRNPGPFGADGIHFEGEVRIRKELRAPEGLIKSNGTPKHDAPNSLALASSCTEPKEWARESTVLKRSITRTWDCCCPEGEVIGSATTSATPEPAPFSPV